MAVARVGQPVKDRQFLSGVERRDATLSIVLRGAEPFSKVIVGTHNDILSNPLRLLGFNGIPILGGAKLSGEIEVFAAKTNETRLQRGTEFLLWDPVYRVLLGSEALLKQDSAIHASAPHHLMRASGGMTEDGDFHVHAALERGDITITVNAGVSKDRSSAHKEVERKYGILCASVRTERVSTATFTNIGTFSLADRIIHSMYGGPVTV